MRRKIFWAAAGIFCMLQTVSAMGFGGFEIEMGTGAPDGLPENWEQPPVFPENSWAAEGSNQLPEETWMIQGEESIPQDPWITEDPPFVPQNPWITEGNSNVPPGDWTIEGGGNHVQNSWMQETVPAPSLEVSPGEPSQEVILSPTPSTAPTPKVLSPTPNATPTPKPPSPTPVPKKKRTLPSGQPLKEKKKDTSRKEELQIYSGTTVLEKGEEPEIQVISDGTVQVLSFRIAGQECGWEWQGDLLCAKETSLEESQVLEYVLLYEKENNIVVKGKK